jgi:hemin uptake protein HemP
MKTEGLTTNISSSFFLKGRREVVIRDEHQKYKANITRPEVIHGKYFPNGNIT